MRNPAWALVLPLVLAVGACGLPDSGDAHAVGTPDLPLPPTPSPTVARPGAPTVPPERHLSVQARVYFVRERKVAPVTTIVRTRDANPMVVGADLLDQLVIGPTGDLARSMTSKLMGQRRIELVEVDGKVAVVELGPPPASGGETRDGLWTAQVVMTLCSIRGISAVRFTGIEGDGLMVVLPNGKLVTGDVSPTHVADAVDTAVPARPVPTGRVRSAPVTPTSSARPSGAQLRRATGSATR